MGRKMQPRRSEVPALGNGVRPRRGVAAGLLWAGLTLGAGAACNGTIIDSQSPGVGAPGDNPGTGPGPGVGTPGAGGTSGSPGTSTEPPAPSSAQLACPRDGTESTGRRVLRRLTIAELDATIRGVFALDTAQWAGPSVPPDPASLDGFGNNVDRLTVSPDYARGALDTAKKVATLVASDEVLPRLLACSTAGGNACATTFVATFGPRLYRRPLTPAEQGRYLALFDKVSRQGDFKSFVYWTTLTMLQSPHVLYRSELGEPDGAGRYKLTPYEIAGSLAYTYTGGPPSAELTQLAATGRLATPDQIETAARALVFDAFQKVKPTFRGVVLRFADEWLGLSVIDNVQKNATSFPDFNAQVQASLGEETRRFLTGIVLEDKGTPAQLLTAPYTFVDGNLARFYGFGTAAGADFVKVDRPAGWGVGLLAQGGLLAVEAHDQATSPTKRGYLVRTRIMCRPVPPPPDNVPQLPEPTAAQTTRQRYEQLHAVEPACKGCHQLLDPIGFGFEHLDATGRFRAREGNVDIDDSGMLADTTTGDVPFKGPTELAQAVAKLPETATCMASYMAAYALGVNQPNASCLVQSAANELRGGMSLLDYYIRMSRSEHFRTRLP
jgi:hypothetical protein